MDPKRIGFVSTRLAGNDGVSLETFKWAQVLERMGMECYYMAGELETPHDRSLLVPSCHPRSQGSGSSGSRQDSWESAMPAETLGEFRYPDFLHLTKR
jgi:hypothetical protein